MLQLSLAHAPPQTPQVASELAHHQRRRMARPCCPRLVLRQSTYTSSASGRSCDQDRVGDVLPVAAQEFLFVGRALAFGRGHQIVRAVLAEQIQVVLDHVGFVGGGLVAVGEAAQLAALSVLGTGHVKGVLLGIKLGGVEFARMAEKEPAHKARSLTLCGSGCAVQTKPMFLLTGRSTGRTECRLGPRCKRIVHRCS